MENSGFIKVVQIPQTVPHKNMAKNSKKVRGALVPQGFLVLEASFTNRRCSKKLRACPHLLLENN